MMYLDAADTVGMVIISGVASGYSRYSVNTLQFAEK